MRDGARKTTAQRSSRTVGAAAAPLATSVATRGAASAPIHSNFLCVSLQPCLITDGPSLDASRCRLPSRPEGPQVMIPCDQLLYIFRAERPSAAVHLIDRRESRANCAIVLTDCNSWSVAANMACDFLSFAQSGWLHSTQNTYGHSSLCKESWRAYSYHLD